MSWQGRRQAAAAGGQPAKQLRTTARLVRDGAAHEDGGDGEAARRADEDGAQEGAARATVTLTLATTHK